MAITSPTPKGAAPSKSAKPTITPIERALEGLAYEIRHLPVDGRRVGFEIEHSWLWLVGPRLPEAVFAKHYRALRAKVTAARFERAMAEMAKLSKELVLRGGAKTWPTELETRLQKWVLGYEASKASSVEAYFSEGMAIAAEIESRIEALKPAPKYAPGYSPKRSAKGPKFTGGASRSHGGRNRARN